MENVFAKTMCFVKYLEKHIFKPRGAIAFRYNEVFYFGNADLEKL